MSNVRIAADGSEEVTVTMLEFSKRVPVDDFFDILGELIANRRARITLTSGIRAEATLLMSTAVHTPPAQQSILPLREYQGDAMLTFELPGRVQVRASSDEEARSIIADVVRNRRKAPPGFSIAFSGDAIDTINLRLQAAMAEGPRSGRIPVQDVILINLTECALLGAPT